MKNARIHPFALATLLAPLLVGVGAGAGFAGAGCAAGSMSPDVPSGSVAPQSEANDAGGAAEDGATAVNPTPGDDAGAPSDDAASPTSDDAGPTGVSDDAGPPPVASEDAGPPAEDSSAPPSDDAGSPSSCPGYALPDTPSSCTCDPSLHTCTANGCYNGYYCKLAGYKCVAPPAGC